MFFLKHYGKIQDSRHDCLECEARRSPADRESAWKFRDRTLWKGKKARHAHSEQGYQKSPGESGLVRSQQADGLTGCELHLCEQEKKMGSFVGKLLSFLLFLVFSLWISNHSLAILNTNYLLSRLSAMSMCPMSHVYLKGLLKERILYT